MNREQWRETEVKYTGHVEGIVIPEWPTEGQVKNIAARVDAIYTKAMFLQGSARIEDDNIDRLIDKVTKANLTGRNESERKVNAIRAAMNYNMPNGSTVDLYELQEETNRRIVFMDSVIRALEFKIRSLTLAYGALKIESSLIK